MDIKITVLVENTACSEDLGHAHGLSLYIETEKHHILFDAGPDGKLLLANAEALGIDLKKVDTAILSHGHYDHAGGLSAFLEINESAKLYMHRLAPAGHYAAESVGFRYIGLAPDITEKYSGRIAFTDDVFSIDDELTLFSDIKTADFLSGSNTSLFEENEGAYEYDRFLHEQDLLICRGSGTVLVAGCAHRGIINIIRRAAEISGREPAHVFSGFHLTNPGLKLDEPAGHVQAVAGELEKLPCRYYTGHCTGKGPYGIMKTILSSRLAYLSGGTTFRV